MTSARSAMRIGSTLPGTSDAARHGPPAGLRGATARSGASTRSPRAGAESARGCSRARAGSGARVACRVRRHDRAEERRHGWRSSCCRAAVGVGRSLRRPDLEAMGLALEGERCRGGAFAEGLRLLDGERRDGDRERERRLRLPYDDLLLDACGVRGRRGCRARASQWCEVTTEYALRYGMRNIFAICRASYAGVLISCGRWEEAEAELARAAREFARSGRGCRARRPPGSPSCAAARAASPRRPSCSRR